jgi:hypothetical protein
MGGAQGTTRGEAALRASLRERGFAYSRIVGDSMLPSLREGDMVLLQESVRLRPGDIVTIAMGGSLVTHRILSIDETGVVCRGDNRRRADPAVARQAVVAQVTQVVGRPMPDRARDALRVRVRQTRWGLATRLTRVRDECALVLGSTLGRQPGVTAAVSASGFASGSIGGPPEYVVRAGDLADLESLPARGADVVLVIPASLYGGLSPARRREFMKALRGCGLRVYGLPFASAGRITHLVSHLRRVMRALGFEVGEPGDMAVRDGAGLRVVHTFTALELVRELERFGLGPVAVERVATDGGPLLCATVGPA